jgi:hypothetical protein
LKGVTPFVLLALNLAPGDQDPRPTMPPFTAPMAVDQTFRLALTPVVDGNIETEEWDPLAVTSAGPTYFQWEPDRMYWAAEAPIGRDVVFSLDQNGDGWLVGDDNLEIRVTWRSEGPAVSTRVLDATDPNGPQWFPGRVLPESLDVAAQQSGETWRLEAAHIPTPEWSPQAGRRVGVRVDGIEAGADTGPAFFPRPVTMVTLQTDVGRGLPPGFAWKPDFGVRSVPVEDTFRAKYGFEGGRASGYDRLEFRGEGFARQLMSEVEQPFPVPDGKDRGRFEFATALSPAAKVGYRVVRVTLKGTDGPETVLRSSFRIAELLDFDLSLPKSLPLSPEARIVRGHVTLRSNGTKQIRGDFAFQVPDEWTQTKGQTANVTIYHGRGVQRVPLEFIVPKDTVGVFPLRMSVKIGEKTVDRTVFLPIGQD